MARVNFDGNMAALRKYEAEIDRRDKLMLQITDRLRDQADEIGMKVEELLSDLDDLCEESGISTDWYDWKEEAGI